jgi:hypothetical protein
LGVIFLLIIFVLYFCVFAVFAVVWRCLVLFYYILRRLTAVKYHTWGSEHVSFIATAQAMFHSGGLRPFFKGVLPTVCRDCVFGGVYATLRMLIEKALVSMRKNDPKALPQTKRHMDMERVSASIIAASMATIFSAPHNFARNIAYASPVDSPAPTIRSSFRRLLKGARTSSTPLTYLQDRLRLGWGTARVGVGMALGNELYTFAKEHLERPR